MFLLRQKLLVLVHEYFYWTTFDIKMNLITDLDRFLGVSIEHSIWVRCIPLSLWSKIRRRSTPLLPNWIYSCRSRVTVCCAIPPYDKRDDFNFHITNFPFLSSNISSIEGTGWSPPPRCDAEPTTQATHAPEPSFSTPKNYMGIGTYDGNGLSNDFLSHFESVSQINHWTEMDRDGNGSLFDCIFERIGARGSGQSTQRWQTKLSEENRSTEGCSMIKRSVDMTSSGKNGLNIRTNASPKWDRTRCPEE